MVVLSFSASCSRVDLVASVGKIFAPERCQLILPGHPTPLAKSLSDRSMQERSRNSRRSEGPDLPEPTMSRVVMTG